MDNWLNKISKSGNTSHPGFKTDIEKSTLDNTDYRRVLFTAKNSQLVLMSLRPGEEIGMESHGIDQFFRFESGEGKVIINGTNHIVKDGDAIIVPQDAEHNVINTSSTEDLKLYTIYSPPNHKKDVVHKTKDSSKEEHFDGQTDV